MSALRFRASVGCYTCSNSQMNESSRNDAIWFRLGVEGLLPLNG